MPLLDVTELLYDPDFCETLDVTRTTQAQDVHGRNVTTNDTLTPIGVVTIGAIDEIVRGADYEHNRNVITVHSPERLLDITMGYQADIVTYHGEKYVVRQSYNWSSYGQGFYMAECELQQLVSTL